MAKGGSTPAAPDYAKLGQQTAQSNLDMAKYATAANRINQTNPFGSLQYTKQTTPGAFDEAGYNKALQAYQKPTPYYVGNFTDPEGDMVAMGSGSGTTGTAPRREDFMSPGQDTWSAETKLDPTQQRLLDFQNQSSLRLGGLQDQLAGQVEQKLSQGFDVNALPAQQINAGQTAQDAIMARLQPSFERQGSQLETKLANQGIAPGTEAWKNAQLDLTQARNDAYSQAALQGIGVGQQARQQALQEQAFLRNEPLQMLNQVRSGAAPNIPNFSVGGQQATTPGVDFLGAGQNAYQTGLGASNASNAQASQFNTGLMSLAAMAMMASDRRLKKNIKQIGKTPGGLNVYSYDYVWGQPSTGVMADEVEKVIPDAVVTHPSGYKMVNYAKVR